MKTFKSLRTYRLSKHCSPQWRKSTRSAPLASFSTKASTPASSYTLPNWNADESLFTFTGGRFLYNEENQMAQRTVCFDMNELAGVAASSIGADRCVHVEKCPESLYNKTYLFRMDDGREVIGKVLNPKAGRAHYTIASEVATMDYVRSILSTPAPKVLAWDSLADRNIVGAEYIIMEKAEGVPLSRVWPSLGYPERARLLRQTFDFMSSWLASPLPGYGGLYYAADVPTKMSLPLPGALGDMTDGRFVVGPAVGRDWCDDGRKGLVCDRGPWTSVLDYRRAIGAREQAAVKHLPGDAKQLIMLTGPGLYQPTPSKKLWALDAYLQVLEHVLPKGDPESRDMLRGRLWHDDLDGENIFVNPAEPTQITAIIDWQSAQSAPLFDHAMEPSFFDYDGPDVGEEFEMPGPLDTTGLSEAEKATAMTEHYDRGLMIAWRGLIRDESPVQYQTIKFKNTMAGGILRAAPLVYVAGEAQLAALILELRDKWPSGSKFPVALTAEEEERIKSDADGAEQGANLVSQIMAQLPAQWPTGGLASIAAHEDYDEFKALLTYARDEIARQCFGDGETARKGFLENWPFDT